MTVNVGAKRRYAKQYRVYKASVRKNTPLKTYLLNKTLMELTEEYVDTKFEQDAELIDNLTYDLIYNELELTHSTANMIQPWLEPAIESSDL